jgi:hypothetical protein
VAPDQRGDRPQAQPCDQYRCGRRRLAGRNDDLALPAGRRATYSSIVIPMYAIEQDATDAYLDALLALHLRCLGFN